MSDTTKKLEELFTAEREVRRLHIELVDGDQAPLVAQLATAIAATENLDEDERVVRLVRIASLLGELEGPKTVDLLIDILAADEPEARRVAGEALEEHAFDRFKEVALGIERALERMPNGSPALYELPYLLLEVGEPGIVKLLGKFLQHKDPEAVASAIEALVEFGDPSASAMFAALEKDTREVPLEDDEGEEGRVTLGELAREAREILAAAAPESAPGGDDRGRPRGAPSRSGR